VSIAYEVALAKGQNASRYSVTVNDIVRANPQVVAQYTKKRRRVLENLRDCGTSQMGGRRLQCDSCGHQYVVYASCRDRHCPSCLQHRSAEWVEKQRKLLLPVGYFHVVFTMPQAIAELALGNKKVIYEILFNAAVAALRTIARDPEHLGARLGFLAILHTWNQRMGQHPHVHFVVPAGGFSLDQKRWVPSDPDYFLPTRVLAAYYRGAFLKQLEAAFDAGLLRFKGRTAIYGDEIGFKKVLLGSLWKKQWVVYAKAPFGSPERVLKYLARYTHKVAISNSRLLSFRDNRVTFRYRMSAESNRMSTMTLDGPEFLRRLMLHVLPKGFKRIRYYGFLATTVRREMLPVARRLIAEAGAAVREMGPCEPVDQEADETRSSASEIAVPCPKCEDGRMVVVAELISCRPGCLHRSRMRHRRRLGAPDGEDTS
jgi:hypothetical protein